MSRFVEQAIARAGLAPILTARRHGDLEAVRALIASMGEIDLLTLGAVADMSRAVENGDVVRVHPYADPHDETGRRPQLGAVGAETQEVTWIGDTTTDLEMLRAVAMARVTGPLAARIGVDWGRYGLELAQVALGFGATDLTGPITRKSGDIIHPDDLRKVKGQGMVAATALKRREIAALVRNAGRCCEFSDEAPSSHNPPTLRSSGDAAHA